MPFEDDIICSTGKRSRSKMRRKHSESMVTLARAAKLLELSDSDDVFEKDEEHALVKHAAEGLSKLCNLMSSSSSGISISPPDTYNPLALFPSSASTSPLSQGSQPSSKVIYQQSSALHHPNFISSPGSDDDYLDDHNDDENEGEEEGGEIDEDIDEDIDEEEDEHENMGENEEDDDFADNKFVGHSVTDEITNDSHCSGHNLEDARALLAIQTSPQIQISPIKHAITPKKPATYTINGFPHLQHTSLISGTLASPGTLSIAQMLAHHQQQHAIRRQRLVKLGQLPKEEEGEDDITHNDITSNSSSSSKDSSAIIKSGCEEEDDMRDNTLQVNSDGHLLPVSEFGQLPTRVWVNSHELHQYEREALDGIKALGH
eukprot:m.79990 g.79990  ORF g.79990 m.79990 type:complete len:374 (-) comp8616_c10_seq2:160-1281(-)